MTAEKTLFPNKVTVGGIGVLGFQRLLGGWGCAILTPSPPNQITAPGPPHRVSCLPSSQTAPSPAVPLDALPSCLLW